MNFKQVRSVSPDDLLGRESVRFQVEQARGVVAGRSVMVTGAGGSIGGELCRQIIRLAPAELLLLGRGENSIFEITNELRALGTGVELVPLIADVRDADRLRVLSTRHQPQLILHAAAHKHVPLMEDNPEEAVLVNGGGTANLVEFARRVAAERFVLISTDKAAQATSIMGATKKLAELIVRHAQANGDRDPFHDRALRQCAGQSRIGGAVFPPAHCGRSTAARDASRDDPLLHDHPRGRPAGDRGHGAR